MGTFRTLRLALGALAIAALIAGGCAFTAEPDPGLGAAADSRDGGMIGAGGEGEGGQAEPPPDEAGYDAGVAFDASAEPEPDAHPPEEPVDCPPHAPGDGDVPDGDPGDGGPPDGEPADFDLPPECEPDMGDVPDPSDAGLGCDAEGCADAAL